MSHMLTHALVNFEKFPFEVHFFWFQIILRVMQYCNFMAIFSSTTELRLVVIKFQLCVVAHAVFHGQSENWGLRRLFIVQKKT